MRSPICVLLGCALAAVADAPAAAPAPRHGLAMAYDRGAGRVLLFGGVDHFAKPSVQYADTWAWDGRAWAEIGRTGPSARIWSAMAYDVRSGRVLLFGGFDGERTLNDSWRWEVDHWLPLQPAHSPPARWHFAMAYDEARRQVLLFGGVNHIGKPAVYGDTWIWDGADWKQAANQGPSPRFGHAMAYDPSRRTVVLFGGRDKDQKPLGETWEWDGAAWRQIRIQGPSPRLLHGMAFDQRRRALLVFGGWDASESATGYLSDAWELKGARWKRLAAPGLPGSRAHFMVNDVRRKRIVLFGGYTPAEALGTTWEWDGATWRRCATR